ncbi:hypothetical protein ABZP36_004734 [Zizania latifolia]
MTATAAVAASGRRDDELALQLAKLRMLLEALRASRGRGPEGEGGGNGPERVALVGMGPRDPELLTLKAVRAIEAADLVLYDRLVSNDVLDLVGESARLLYVGKMAGYHSRTQEEIHELLLSFAEASANVVRLRGGDPLVFGRGGEEMDFLQQQGIRIEVIPDKGPKEHHAAQPQKRPRKGIHEISVGIQGTPDEHFVGFMPMPIEGRKLQLKN